MHEPAAVRERLAQLELEPRAQRVALEHRRGVVGSVPAEDRHQPGQRPRGLGGGERDRVPAVDEPALVVRRAPASRWAIATFSVSRASAGAESTTSPPSSSSVQPSPSASKCGPGARERNAARSSPRAAATSASCSRSSAPPTSSPSSPVRLAAQRQHRAAREVQHRAVLLVDGADPQHGEAGRARAVLAPRDDLGRRPQRVAEPHRPAQQQPAVEEVRDHAAGGDRRLADRDVPDERRVRERRPGAEHGLAERAVERSRSRSPQIAWCSAAWPSVSVSARRVLEDGPDRQVLEVRRRAHARLARAREHAPRGDGERLVEHPVAGGHGARAVGGRALERGERLARLGDLVVGRRERLAQRVELRRVDRPLAVVAERARVRDRGAERLVVADRQVRAVDRLDPGRARGDEHRVLREAPVARPPPPGAPERGGEVGVAEDQPVQALARARQLAGAPAARPRSRSAPAAARASSRPAAASAPASSRSANARSAALSTFGSTTVTRSRARARHRGEVQVAPRRADRVHAHGHRRRRELLVERGDDRRARLVLGGRDDRVLEVEHDLVGLQRAALLELRGRGGGDDEAGAASGHGPHASVPPHDRRTRPRRRPVRSHGLRGPAHRPLPRRARAGGRPDRARRPHRGQARAAALRARPARRRLAAARRRQPGRRGAGRDRRSAPARSRRPSAPTSATASRSCRRARRRARTTPTWPASRCSCARSIDRFDATARESGARIVHACGFDSIPSDLGVLALHRAVQRDGAGELEDTTFVLERVSGGFSGGTLDSLRGQLDEMRRDPALRKIAGDPYALSPDRAAEPDLGKERELQSVERNDELGWLAPFVMAGINTRVVRRSNALQDHAYGRRFRYREVDERRPRPARPGARRARSSPALGGLVAGHELRPDAQAARPGPPRPRRGPEREDPASAASTRSRSTGARAPAAATCRASSQKGDPGYAATARAVRRERAVPGAGRRPPAPGRRRADPGDRDGRRPDRSACVSAG